MSTPFNDPNAQQPYAAPAPSYPSYPAAAPVPQPSYVPQPQQAYAPKSKVAAAVLAFFLGSLGIHDFYLGYTKAGVFKLVLLIVGAITSFMIIGVPILIALEIWVFVDFICVLLSSGRMSRDSNGVPLN